MHSMTGMGRAAGSVLGTSVRVEIKSVNHRFCEVNFRAPGRYNILEIELQNTVKQSIRRGRVDVMLFEEKSGEVLPTEKEAFQSYHSYLTNIKQCLNLDEEITLSHLLGGVGSWINRELDAKSAWADLKVIVEKALEDLKTMKAEEGARLKTCLADRFAALRKIKDEIAVHAGECKEILEEKLNNRIKEKLEQLENFDQNRLHSEIVYYLDRLDISEELDRLSSHFKQADTFLNSKEPVGRKMDFLLQEFNREFNTVASKCQNSSVAHLAVEGKAELEKIREQIQNIE